MRDNLENDIIDGFHIRFEEDYDMLKKTTVNLHKNEQNFWSRVFKEIEIIMSKNIVECVDPSFYYKILKYNIIRIKTGQSRLKRI